MADIAQDMYDQALKHVANREDLEALKLFVRSADLGNTGAQRIVGQSYIKMSSPDKILEGMRYLQEAAESGDAVASQILSKAYEEGIGTTIPRNASEAERYRNMPSDHKMAIYDPSQTQKPQTEEERRAAQRAEELRDAEHRRVLAEEATKLKVEEAAQKEAEAKATVAEARAKAEQEIIEARKVAEIERLRIQTEAAAATAKATQTVTEAEAASRAEAARLAAESARVRASTEDAAHRTITGANTTATVAELNARAEAARLAADRAARDDHSHEVLTNANLTAEQQEAITRAETARLTRQTAIDNADRQERRLDREDQVHTHQTDAQISETRARGAAADVQHRSVTENADTHVSAANTEADTRLITAGIANRAAVAERRAQWRARNLTRGNFIGGGIIVSILTGLGIYEFSGSDKPQPDQTPKLTQNDNGTKFIANAKKKIGNGQSVNFDENGVRFEISKTDDGQYALNYSYNGHTGILDSSANLDHLLEQTAFVYTQYPGMLSRAAQDPDGNQDFLDEFKKNSAFLDQGSTKLAIADTRDRSSIAARLLPKPETQTATQTASASGPNDPGSPTTSVLPRRGLFGGATVT